ncbi:helix-hairpin-helix domain-containing protein [Sphingobacterium sp. UT-1RO-CII-1]|uniref:ComEA family DNA-binding protein n=1 Tax=Sphingobacterium sp. UT-1RO-CII-1 TaxID=2995225 RepID=UPI00227AFBC8|nr:helix-hairpin-helix domain-containing protein [Sphingobacterium sp. UT-1RO-CII-1]MCY4779838.1 helix-hairpin-helix domain-containing protein [Sphingobacterium sp. UT-1RO-CII-1]
MFLISHGAKAQDINLVEEQIVEQVMDELEEGIDISEFTERLRYYYRHPIDINKTDGTELTELLFLNPFQITSLLQHRAQTGNFISILELQVVSGFDVKTVELLEPFITVNEGYFEKTSVKDFITNSEQQLMLRYGRILEKQHGYHVRDSSRSRYLGDPNRYMLRYRMNYQNDIRLAINMKKDAGEPFFKEKQRYGFDHYGFSVYIRNKGIFKSIVLGDYSLQSGQGLVLWNGLSFGKGAMITSSARQAAGLNSYTSMNESDYLRGVAATLTAGKFEVTPFVSWRKLSGNLIIENEGSVIKSISKSGLHRTQTEQQYRNAIKQFTTGVDWRYKNKRLQLGFLALYNRLNAPYMPEDNLRNLYAFRKPDNTNVGFNYQYTFRNIFLYGEFAHQLSQGWATNNGVIASLHPKLSLFFNYRNYDKKYFSAFAQGLGETRATTNETGLYTGIVYHPNRTFSWLNYIDLFKFPWLRYRVDAPSSGADFLSQLSYSWYKIGELSFRYRYRFKQENTAAIVPERYLADVERQQVRVSFRYKLNEIWEIRSRVEAAFYEKDGVQDYGGLVYQDVFWKPLNKKIQLNSRLAFFNTDSYETRIYAYENDVLYASSFPLYNKKGWRSYINARYRLGRHVDFWLRYAITVYRNEDSVGSGLEKSEGNRRSDIKIQFRYQW